MEGRKLARSISLLTMSNLWASGSSFVLFAIAARVLNARELGAFALTLACTQLVTYLADGGLTAYTVREVARTSSLATLNWNLRRRVVVALVVTIPLAAMSIPDVRMAEVALVLLVSIANSWYSAIVAVLFAVAEPVRVVRIQFLNGWVFVVAGAVAGLVWQSPAGFLSMVMVSYVLLLASEADLVRSTLTTPQARPALRGQAPFVISGLAYGVNSAIDLLVLGRRSAVNLAEYAGAQRVALGLGALSRAASGLLLPAFARRPVYFGRLPIVLSAVAAVGGGGALGWALTPIVNALYGDDLVDSWVMALLCSAYAMDAVLVLISSNLIAKSYERALAVVAVGQLSVTVGGLALLLHYGPIGVAVAVLSGRVVGLLMLAVLERWDFVRGAAHQL